MILKIFGLKPIILSKKSILKKRKTSTLGYIIYNFKASDTLFKKNYNYFPKTVTWQ